MNYSGTISFTNESNNYMVVADGLISVFQGAYSECKKYVDNNPLYISKWSSYSLVPPHKTIEIKFTQGYDSQS